MKYIIYTTLFILFLFCVGKANAQTPCFGAFGSNNPSCYAKSINLVWLTAYPNTNPHLFFTTDADGKVVLDTVDVGVTLVEGYGIVIDSDTILLDTSIVNDLISDTADLLRGLIAAIPILDSNDFLKPTDTTDLLGTKYDIDTLSNGVYTAMSNIPSPDLQGVTENGNTTTEGVIVPYEALKITVTNGDSWVVGVGADGGDTMARVVARQLNTNLLNYGVSGQTLTSGAPYGSSLIDSTYKIPIYNASTYAYMAIMIGVNDWRNPNTTQANPTTFGAAQQRYIDSLFARGWPANKIVWASQNVTDARITAEQATKPSATRALLVQFYDTMEAVALRNNCLYFDGYSLIASNYSALMYSDGLHASSAGQSVLGDGIANTLGLPYKFDANNHVTRLAHTDIVAYPPNDTFLCLQDSSGVRFISIYKKGVQGAIKFYSPTAQYLTATPNRLHLGNGYGTDYTDANQFQIILAELSGIKYGFGVANNIGMYMGTWTGLDNLTFLNVGTFRKSLFVGSSTTGAQLNVPQVNWGNQFSSSVDSSKLALVITDASSNGDYGAKVTVANGLEWHGGRGNIDKITARSPLYAEQTLSVGNSANVTYNMNTSGKISEYGNATPATNQILVGDNVDMELTNFTTVATDVSTSAITSTGGLTLTDMETTRYVDATSGNITITITPSLAGQTVNLKRIDGSGNTVTVQGASGQIDGAASTTIPAAGATRANLPLQWDGTNYLIK